MKPSNDANSLHDNSLTAVVEFVNFEYIKWAELLCSTNRYIWRLWLHCFFLSINRESSARVVHDTCIVITKAKCVSIIHLVCSSIAGPNVVMQNSDILVSVYSVMLMVESYCMTQLVNNSGECNTVWTQKHCLRLEISVLSSNV